MKRMRWWPAAKRLAAPLGTLECDILLERPLEQPLPAPVPSLEVTLRQAGEADLDLVCAHYAEDPWLFLGEGRDERGRRESGRSAYLDRLRRGERCFIAMHGGEIAHLNWVCFGWGDAVPGHPIRLREGEAYTTDALTPPAFRGRGLHAFVLHAMLEHARSRGVRRAFTLANLDRAGSHGGLATLGWRECGRVIHLTRRGRSVPWIVARRGFVEPLFRAERIDA
ncbi:MAG: hypothetical protein KIT25_04390 [Enhydrobacter sp.]|nr:MAG: hypothetical protein KIT25_04390 [Enhydrobacter sp.]